MALGNVANSAGASVRVAVGAGRVSRKVSSPSHQLKSSGMVSTQLGVIQGSRYQATGSARARHDHQRVTEITPV